MRLRAFASAAFLLVLAAACGTPDLASGSEAELQAMPEASEDLGRDVLSTALELDLASKRGKATLRVATSDRAGLSFEVGDLAIASVTSKGVPLKHEVLDVTGTAKSTKRRLDVGVPVAAGPSEIVVTYTFKDHSSFDGWVPSSNVSFLWPYFCGNLFPCHSNPADGSTFKIAITGVPAGQTAVFPESIPFDAPAYMPAIAVGKFEYTRIGKTPKGTEVGVYTLPDSAAGVTAATAKMVDIFAFFEREVGDYKFGNKVASVDAKWGPGAFGGMEHHPFWHVGADSLADEEVHAHEAAHGWYGNGVRLRCWEDFVLSEGTVSYLAARAIEETRGPTAGDALWARYKTNLSRAIAEGDTRAWPQTCGAIDILNDRLWSSIPYMKGAFFYRKVAETIGVAKLDAIIAGFYKDNVGRAASMGAMIQRIQEESSFDPKPLVDAWLKGLGDPGT